LNINQDEQFRLRTAEALGRIEERGEDMLRHLIALNVTISSQGERITVLESSWRTGKVLGGGLIASVAAGAAMVVAWFRISGN
jgi:hypothetical protein